MVDLNNKDYNYQTTHEHKESIPVYVLRLWEGNRNVQNVTTGCTSC